MSVMEKVSNVRPRRNETDVDREMEKLSAKMLIGPTEDGDLVRFESLKSWRRNNLVNVMSKAERKKRFG